MKKLVLVLVLVPLLAGCNAIFGVKQGQIPGEITCDGKATLSGMGNANVAAVFGGSEGNGFQITFDCGPGAHFGFQQTPAVTPTVPPVVAPKP